jgi:hypothetical protein
MATRAAVAVVTLVVAGLAVAPSASAVMRSARFQVSLTGTYASTGVATETGCYTLDAHGGRVPIADQSGRAAETTTFASPRPTVVAVSRIDRGPLVAGRVRPTRPLPLDVRVTRLSALGPTGAVRACRPAAGPDPVPADCGTKARTFAVDLYGVATRSALGFRFIRRNRFVFLPVDVFHNCSLVPAQVWFGFFDHAVAYVSPTRLFNTRRRTLVLHGRHAGRRSAGMGSTTGTTFFRERYTLTLRRTG